MKFIAKAKGLPFSPYKLRPIADVIRGKDVKYVLNWLDTYKTKRTIPLKKVLESAAANAKNLKDLESDSLRVKTITVDEGKIFRYYKPGSMGKASPQKRRFSHVNVVLECKTEFNKKA